MADKSDKRATLTDINRVVHEPARLMILANLYVVESGDFTFLMSQTDLTWGNISSHMRKLEDAGYVSVHKEFVDRKPHTMLSLTEEGRQALLNYRKQMQQFMKEIPD